jgi:hypothetical protein
LYFVLRCSVCQLVVHGQSRFCMTCGHGGHAAHLREWFELETLSYWLRLQTA